MRQASAARDGGGHLLGNAPVLHGEHEGMTLPMVLAGDTLVVRPHIRDLYGNQASAEDLLRVVLEEAPGEEAPSPITPSTQVRNGVAMYDLVKCTRLPPLSLTQPARAALTVPRCTRARVGQTSPSGRDSM